VNYIDVGARSNVGGKISMHVVQFVTATSEVGTGKRALLDPYRGCNLDREETV
jgi:hypothetical protein